MEIELKDLNSGTEKNSSQEPVESCIEEVIKNLVKVALQVEAKGKYKEACRVVKVIISNILNNPQEDKYRIIKKNNQKFLNAFGNYEAGANLLETIGFELVEDTEPIYIYSHLDISILQQALRIIEKATSRSEVLAEIHEKRLKNPLNFPLVLKKEHDLHQQLQQYRDSKKRLAPQKVKIMTLMDLDQQSKPINSSKVPRETYNSIQSFTDPRNLQIRTFELSNQFRASQGLAALIWNDGLIEIARVHSSNMGENKVPFGHQGFSKRFRKFPFRYTRKGAENVAYNYGVGDPAKVSVDGWIKSPGHRKNLLGNFSHMGIGVYINSAGYFYFTQLFALSN